jgi:hypothetical protein
MTKRSTRRSASSVAWSPCARWTSSPSDLPWQPWRLGGARRCWTDLHRARNRRGHRPLPRCLRVARRRADGGVSNREGALNVAGRESLRIWRLGFESLAARQTCRSRRIKQEKLNGQDLAMSVLECQAAPHGYPWDDLEVAVCRLMLIEIEAVKDTWQADPASASLCRSPSARFKARRWQPSSAHTGQARGGILRHGPGADSRAYRENTWYKVAGQLPSAAIGRTAMAGPAVPDSKPNTLRRQRSMRPVGSTSANQSAYAA